MSSTSSPATWCSFPPGVPRYVVISPDCYQVLIPTRCSMPPGDAIGLLPGVSHRGYQCSFPPGVPCYVMMSPACYLVYLIRATRCSFSPGVPCHLVMSPACYLVFRAVGPLVTLLVLNVFLIRALHAARRRHQLMSSSAATTSTSRRSSR